MVLATSVGLVGCVQPDVIKIGAVRSLTGSLKTLGDLGFGPVMNYWVDEVNATGGIYVAEYDKKLKIDLTIQDDKSDLTFMFGNLTAMVTSGDYHFVLPPVNTQFLQIAAWICSANNYVLIGAESDCWPIMDSLAAYPYLFSMLNFSNWNQMEKLFEILRDWQDRSVDPTPTPMNVYILTDPLAFDYTVEFLLKVTEHWGQFNVVGIAAVPADTTAVSPYLEAAQALGADLFCSFTYPPTALAAISQASAPPGINFDAMIVFVPGNFEFMLLDPPNGFGGNMEGVMSFGAWNEYSSNETADFAANYTNFLGGRGMMDWWGAAPYYAGLQCLQQAIERAGTLDNDDVRAELAAAWPGSPTNPPFDTVLGDVYFTQADGSPVPVTGTLTGGLLAKDCYLGQIGQWQKVEAPYWGGNATNPRAKPYGIGNATEWYIFEVIDLDDNQTADGLYPKPEWQ